MASVSSIYLVNAWVKTLHYKKYFGCVKISASKLTAIPTGYFFFVFGGEGVIIKLKKALN